MGSDQSNFKKMLAKKPLIFTVLPLRDNKTGDAAHDDKIIRNLNSRKEELAIALNSFSRLNAISVPELVEENHEGKPRYNSIYTRALARGTADILHIDALVNKVVAHIENYENFVEWIKETHTLGISNMIFVGGNTRHHRYPGPSVSEANVIARRLWSEFHKEEITIGNISLPERKDEAKRMLFKTLAGAEFFTTQLLFDSAQVINMISEYNRQCAVAGVKPATILFSFGPIRSIADLNLLDFLAVELPDNAKNYILENNDLGEASRRSAINSLRVYSEIISVIEEKHIPVPVGINVEQLTKSNLPSSIVMLENFEKVIDLPATEVKDYLKRISSSLPGQ
jgi:5,10-methylenetetrahydrofolate reductase